jgi:membrane dipeptidase
MRRFLLVLLLTLPLAAAERPVTVDTHADTPTEFLKKPIDLGVVNAEGHFDYPRMKAGKLDAEFFVAYVPARAAGKGAAAYCLRVIETIHRMVEQYPQWVRFADSTDDIRKIVASGKRAILIGIEGGHAIEDSLEVLGSFHRLGARYMTLTHSNHNNWADSSGPKEPKHNGLTDFGRQVVLEMNRLGILVDISHVSDATFYDVIKVTKAPVIASHSSARALADHARNMTDDMLRATAKNGGVVMVNFNPPFLSTEVAQASKAREETLKTERAALKEKYGEDTPAYDAADKLLRDANPLPPVPWTRIVDHIDHIAKVAGIDHVGLGSDFDGISSIPVGMEDVSKLPSIRDELKRRGYSETDIRKVMGENFMRVFARAEEVSRGMRAASPAVASTK